MKRILLIIIISFVLFPSLKAQINDIVTFSLDDVVIDTVGIYTRVSMLDCSTIDSVGHPEMPRFEIRYVLPFDKQVSDVLITDSIIQNIDGCFLLYPKQRETLLDDTIINRILMDSLVYCSANPYFKNTIDYVGQYNEAGYQIALFYLYPFNYIPSQLRLQFCSSISFTIELVDCIPDWERAKTESRRMFEKNREFITSQIRNKIAIDSICGGPTKIVELNDEFLLPFRFLQNEIETLPEYLIITNDRDVNGNEIELYQGQTMTQLFQTFANWKTKKGTPTVVVSIDDITAYYPGNDVQSKIHSFLSDLYQECGSVFVLFGGDTNIVPERISDTIIITSISSNRFAFPTDLYYTAIETSWDSNNNGVYGEFSRNNNDILDNTSEFFYGRASVNDGYEAASFIEKSIAYETLTGIDYKSYVNNVAMIIGALNDNSVSYQNYVKSGPDAYLGLWFHLKQQGIIREIGITQNNIIRWRLYEDYYQFNVDNPKLSYHSIGWENHSFDLCRQNVISSLGSFSPLLSPEEAPHVVYHLDHSSYLTLGTSSKHRNETINRNDVDHFSNGPYCQVLFTFGCSPGEFQKDCIIERFLNNPHGGAVALFASSSSSSGDKEDVCFKKAVSSLYDFAYVNGGSTNALFYNTGIIHHAFCGTVGNDVWGVFIKRKNHLFGDPELPIWTREPLDLTVNATPSIVSNQNNVFTVSVSGMAYSEYSTNDVMVCVMKDDEVYLREAYNGNAHSHDFVFEVNPETNGELKVTVTGHNYIPYETTVPVIIEGKNAYVSAHSVMDTSGNNDGNLDAGETVNLTVSLKNNGTVNLANVSASMSFELLDENLNQQFNNYVNVINSIANYGAIAQNTTLTRNDFQLALANTIPDRSSLRCILTVTDGIEVVCVKSFVFTITASEIEYVSVRHTERPNGRIGLDIELNNLGFGTAKDICATLTTSSGAQITQGTATYGTMSRLEAKTQSFEFNSCGSIENIPFSLAITDAYNKLWMYSFVLKTLSDTIENLTFTNEEQSIKLKWDPVENSRGYYIYRSNTVNGTYERLNCYPVPSSFYSNLGLNPKQTYYYGVSYLDEQGNESQMAKITAWTSLPLADGWPVSISDNLGRAWNTAANVADINGDGKQEIFVTVGDAENATNKGAVLGFNCRGEELFDIDHNPTTISGFANLGINMVCTPAIGDIDNDGIMEIIVATRDNFNSNHKLCVYKTSDTNHDGIPEHVWDRPLDFKNFNGVVLADLDNNGTLEIIAPNQGRNGNYGYTYLEVFNCWGDYYYPKNTIRIMDHCNRDGKAVTMPIVADFDNDGNKEIVFGLEGGVYKWSCSNQELSQLFSCNSSLIETEKERSDCPLVAADIDGDGNLEILFMVIRDLKGYIRAIEINGSSVNSAWSGDNHFVSLSSTQHNWEWPPYFCVADIDNDGNIEVFVADNGALKMWKSDGTAYGIGELQIPNLNCKYYQPIIADIDGNDDCEVIIPSQEGCIFAFKPNGSLVPGWPLRITDLGTIPVVSDIDDDGYNEIVVASETELFVWNTEGRSKNNQWDRFRLNKHNNAVYEIPCSYNENHLVITGVQLWNDDRVINRVVEVQDGACLTIRSELHMSGDAKIIVKPGGRLILDGCKLTSSCFNELWQGIEVWGNKNAHQYAVNGSYGQGYVELKNGAIIENAVCALNLWRPNYWGTTGGIVRASDAVFHNNHMAVHALFYKNHHPTNERETDYNARFIRCQFVVDSDYTGPVFYKHVDLSHVKGFRFYACNFSVSESSNSISMWTSGIAGNEAGFTIDGRCDSPLIPCPNYNQSFFTGFFTAINSISDGSTSAPSITVRHSSFSKNDFGLYIRKLSNASVLFNDFDIKRQDYWQCGAGIFSENVYNYMVEENVFTKNNTYNGNGIGIFIKDSNHQNTIFNNQFSSLSCGNLAEGKNILEYNNEYLGLEYLCNSNSGNDIDFYVLQEPNVYSGIQTPQGSVFTATRNTFSENGYHFFNGGDYKIDYYYFRSPGFENEKPLSYNTDKFSIIATNQTDGCESHFSGTAIDSIVLSSTRKQQLEQEYYEAYNTYHSLKRVYENLVDGGDTQNELNDIGSATPSEMWELRAQLLGHSPYLSSIVLRNVADRDDVFTESVLFEILLSNPDELKKDSLMNYLRDRVPPLSQEMLDVLDEIGLASTTTKTLLQTQMAASRKEFRRAAGDIIRSIVNDTIFDKDELRNWLANLEDLHADREIISTFVDEGDFEKAFALAGLLPNLYGLTGSDLVEHQNYIGLLTLYRNLYNSGRNIMQIDSVEMVFVNDLARFGTGYPQIMAQAILAGIDWERYSENSFVCPSLTLPDRGQDKGRTSMQKKTNTSMGLSALVNPNPATTWIVVNYTMPVQLTKATFKITNPLGVVVFLTELEGNQGQKVLDLRGLAEGAYIYTINCADYTQSGKLIIAR